MTLSHLDGAIELEEAGARGVGVAGAAETRGGAVVSARGAEVDVAARRQAD